MLLQSLTTTNSPPLVTLFIIFAYFMLLAFAISLAFTFYTCRTEGLSKKCWIDSSTKNDTGTEKYNNMCKMILCEGIWPLAYIFSSIFCLIIFTLYSGTMPFTPYGGFPIKEIVIIFIPIFLTWYGILGFTTHHLGRPLREELLKLVNKNV
jgi:hypothetical protein